MDKSIFVEGSDDVLYELTSENMTPAQEHYSESVIRGRSPRGITLKRGATWAVRDPENDLFPDPVGRLEYKVSSLEAVRDELLRGTSKDRKGGRKSSGQQTMNEIVVLNAASTVSAEKLADATDDVSRGKITVEEFNQVRSQLSTERPILGL